MVDIDASYQFSLKVTFNIDVEQEMPLSALLFLLIVSTV